MNKPGKAESHESRYSPLKSTNATGADKGVNEVRINTQIVGIILMALSASMIGSSGPFFWMAFAGFLAGLLLVWLGEKRELNS